MYNIIIIRMDNLTNLILVFVFKLYSENSVDISTNHNNVIARGISYVFHLIYQTFNHKNYSNIVILLIFIFNNKRDFGEKGMLLLLK